MAEILPNLSSPSSAPGAPSSPSKGPDLSTDIRSEVMGGLEGAIEVTSTQASGQGDEKTVATTKKDNTSSGPSTGTATTPAGNVQDIPEDTLLRLTRKKILNQMAALDMTAQKIMRSKSKSQAFNLTRVVSEMRRLHISLQMLYRMAIDRLRDLYTKIQ